MPNPYAKTRPESNPYEIWRSCPHYPICPVDNSNISGGDWEWHVLKKWQIDDNKPYARWFCIVKSPYTFPGYDMGDTYVSDIKNYATLIKENPNV
jgi:hypothetical protein